ncbi:NAD(P)H-binding protein [Glycomyces salinus]|uniref:NAD(P)H-binding protein n=1 Tax=Glycomyces salinus TaxID=980294 RepID=UPI0018ED4875|nr:NAD(P)H-binding protein [Glycomyces salinus]
MIGITGSTGGVGSRTVRHLLAEPDCPPLVAIARRPRAVPRRDGLTARGADYDDPASLERAFAGLETLVFVSSDGRAETMARHHRNVIAAAVGAGVGHVVYTSILDVEPDSRFYYSPAHRETEARLAAAGIDHCLARTSIFADFFTETWLAPALASGELALPIGGSRMSLVSREDVAKALASAARRRSEGVVELTGPAALTGGESCAAAAAAAGRPLRFSDLDASEYRSGLRAEGEPEWLVDAYATMFDSCREGRFSTVSPDIEELTGRPQETFAEFLRRSGIPVG